MTTQAATGSLERRNSYPTITLTQYTAIADFKLTAALPADGSGDNVVRCDAPRNSTVYTRFIDAKPFCETPTKRCGECPIGKEGAGILYSATHPTPSAQ